MTEINLPLEDSPSKLDNHGPLFILGCPRSGTTFLSNCIAGFDKVEEFVGVLCPPRLIHIVSFLNVPRHKELLLSGIRDIFWQSFWRRRTFRYEIITEVMKGNKSLLNIIKKPGIDDSIFSYKEPFLCFAVDDFSTHFKNSKFIHIIRDGRDIADSLERRYPEVLTNQVLMSDELSYNKVSEIGIWKKINGFNIPYWIEDRFVEDFINYSPYERYILMWKVMVESARSLSDKIGTTRYIELRYEDLIKKPEHKINEISDFLNLKTNNKVIKRLRKVFSTSISVSKLRQEDTKLKSAYQIAGDLFSSLGYGK